MDVVTDVVAREPDLVRSHFDEIVRHLSLDIREVEREFAHDVQVSLVLSDNLRNRDLPPTFEALHSEAPDRYIVLLSWDEPEALRAILGSPVDRVVFIPAERSELEPLLHRLGTETDPLEGLPAIDALPPSLRLGILKLHRKAKVAGGEPPARSITPLARDIPCSRPNLNASARSSGYKLPHIIDLFRVRWLLLRAADRRLDVTELAPDLGYPDARGVSGILKRASGMTVREVRALGPRVACDRVTNLLVARLSEGRAS